MTDPKLQAARERHGRRWMNYLRGNGPGNGALVVTPAQRRRIKHKLGHMAALEKALEEGS